MTRGEKITEHLEIFQNEQACAFFTGLHLHDKNIKRNQMQKSQI